MLKLPLDISTFSELRRSNYLYVDKTEYVYKIITGGRRFFLSRPRRFGKSLLISTFYEVLTNNKKLFNDLWIGKSDYQWQEYGVIKLDFSTLITENIASLNESLKMSLSFVAKNYKISLDTSLINPSNIFQSLVHELFIKYGKVAILVDEYDSPILKTLHNEKLATTIRDMIQQFFTIVKGLDQYIQFVFITGVSSFAKAGLFSGINNLQILTLRDEYGAICGYTDEEINHYFCDYMQYWTQKENIPYEGLRQQIKSWYNGYRFGVSVNAVYNPFSLMNALHIRKFENFWFQSGTPRFLVEILKKEHTEIDLKNPKASKDFLGIFDIDQIPPTSLMFQAGYLTIAGYNPKSELLTLDYPNEEVRISFQKYLLEIFAHIESAKAGRLSSQLYEAFEAQDIDGIIEILKQLFAHVPYQLHVKQESYYHSLLMMICIGARIKAQSEYSTSLGSIDLILEFQNLIYIRTYP